jgi:hypothetical protein
MTLEEVESAVTEAFSDAPDPEERIVSNPSHWEAAEIQSDFQGRHWRDISIPPSFVNTEPFTIFRPVDFGTTCPPT